MTLSTEGAGRVQTVLLVDDEPANLAVLSGVLTPHCRVRVASSGAAALRVATSDPVPDLVLLDVMMPELDGYAVLERLREDPRSRDVPIIFVTALGGDGEEERGLELGAVDFITKPIRPSVVLARVRLHLALKEARDRLRHQNAWLETEVERRTRETLMIQDVTLSVLAGLVETRDANTGDHTMRTQAYVELLGRRLAREAPYSEALRPPLLGLMVKAAALHDIGKVGIPDAILSKPGPLTRAEFDVMKTHSRIGADAIGRALQRAGAARAGEDADRGPVAFLEMARKMALWHHERWDGRGYPDGLAGEAIPPCARIMGVADVFDALTSRRPYKAPLGVDEASALILKERGAQFQPVVVDAFAAVRDELAAVLLRFSDAAGPAEGAAAR